MKSHRSLYLEFIPKDGLFHKMLLLSVMGFLAGWCNLETFTPQNYRTESEDNFLLEINKIERNDLWLNVKTNYTVYSLFVKYF